MLFPGCHLMNPIIEIKEFPGPSIEIGHGYMSSELQSQNLYPEWSDSKSRIPSGAPQRPPGGHLTHCQHHRVLMTTAVKRYLIDCFMFSPLFSGRRCVRTWHHCLFHPIFTMINAVFCYGPIPLGLLAMGVLYYCSGGSRDFLLHCR